jgi:MinD superfamily P-loop ATPase
VPEIDTEKCAACGECVRSCEFNALARLGETVMVFDELCHGCGGCMAVCPNRAVSERKKTIGFVESGTAGDTAFVHGRLNVGEAMSPPLIRSVLKCADAGAVNIIDAPPGSSCPVIATVRDAGFVLLVTEPTPFGLNDLSITLDMVNELHRPHGVIINRSGPGDDEVRALCASRRTDVIGGITDDRRIAEACSRGEITAAIMPGVRGLFLELWQSISERAGV